MPSESFNEVASRFIMLRKNLTQFDDRQIIEHLGWLMLISSCVAMNLKSIVQLEDTTFATI